MCFTIIFLLFLNRLLNNWLLLFHLKSFSWRFRDLLEILLVLEICILLILLLTNILIELIIIILFLHNVSRIKVLILKLLRRERFILSSEIVHVLINWLFIHNVNLRICKLFLLYLLTWKFTLWVSLLLASLVLKLVFKIVGLLVLIGKRLSYFSIALVVSIVEIILRLKVILLLSWMWSILFSELLVILSLDIIIIILILINRIMCVTAWSIWATNHAYIIRLKWLEFFIFRSIIWSGTILNNNRLIHEHTLIFYLIIEAFDVLQIINLTSKKS